MVRLLFTIVVTAAIAACGDNVVSTHAPPPPSGNAQTLPLTLSGTAPATVRADRPFRFEPEVKNADKSNLRFFATKPEWMTLDPRTGTLSGTPRSTLGKCVVELEARDGAGAGRSASLVFELEVGVPWTSLSDKAVPAKSASAVLDGKIYILGGEVNRAATANVLIFDPSTGEWKDGPPLPSPRTEFAAVSTGGRSTFSEASTRTGRNWRQGPFTPTTTGASSIPFR